MSEEDDTEDPNNSGQHVDDLLNVPDASGRVLINLSHPEGEEDIFLAPQLSRTVKPHQVSASNVCEKASRQVLESICCHAKWW